MLSSYEDTGRYGEGDTGGVYDDTGKYGEGDIIQMFHDAQLFVSTKGVPDAQRPAAYELIDRIRQMTAAGQYHEAQVLVSNLPASQGDAVRQATYDAIERVRAENTKGSFLDVIASPITALGNLPGIKQAREAVQSGLNVLTNNPLWNLASGVVSFIPGVGTAVSAGMQSAAAIGRGASLKDIGLAAAKGALPGGPVVGAAFDVATGLMQGKSPSDAFIASVRSQVPGGDLGKAAFDAATLIAQGKAVDQIAVNALRSALPVDPSVRAVFDKAIAVHNTVKSVAAPGISTFKTLQAPAAIVARKLWSSPTMGQVSARTIASQGHALDDVKRAMAVAMNKIRGQQIYDWRDVGDADSLWSMAERHGVDVGALYDGNASADTGDVSSVLPVQVRVSLNRPLLQAMYRSDRGGNIKKALLAHGLLARISHATGELDGAGHWTVRSGDTLSKIAQTLVHDSKRYMELYNENKSTIGSNPNLIKVGQRLTVPAGWLGTATPAPVSVPVPLPSTPMPTASSSVARPAGAPPYLAQGSKGPWVGYLQSLIGASVDNDFGPNTALAVKATQLKKGITVDGKVGDQTWRALGVLAPLPIAVPSQFPVPPAGPVPAIPAVPASLPAGADQLTAASIEAMLAVFFQNHPNIDVPGAPLAPLFGIDPADLAGVWNDRATAAMRTFQVWHNRSGSTLLNTDGRPDQASVNALTAEVQSEVAAATGINVPIPTPVVTTTTSSSPPWGSGSGTPGIPIPSTPAVPPPSAPPWGSGSGTPGIPPKPSTPATTVASTTPAKKGNSDMVILAVAAAALFAGGGKGRRKAA